MTKLGSNSKCTPFSSLNIDLDAWTLKQIGEMSSFLNILIVQDLDLLIIHYVMKIN